MFEVVKNNKRCFGKAQKFLGFLKASQEIKDFLCTKTNGFRCLQKGI